MLFARVVVLTLVSLGAACTEAAPGAAGAGGQAPSGSSAGAAGSLIVGGSGGVSTGGAPAAQSGMGGLSVAGDSSSAGGGSAAGAAGGAGVAGSGGSSEMPDPNAPMQHRFLSGISDGGPVALVAADGHIEWQYHVDGEANDAWLLPNGHVVFAYKAGARELTPENVVVWDYSAPAGSEVHSCQPLDGGSFLLGEAHDGGLGYLREIDGAGKLQKSVTVDSGGNHSAHGQFREVRKTPQGTYLVTYIDFNKAREVDDSGKLLREFPCGSFVAIRLPDQNTLIACGDAHRVIEVDPQNAIVWEVTEQEIPGNQLGFAAGLQRLANGNTIICNWPGHGGLPADQPQCFELTRDKHVVWQLKNPELKLVSNLEVVDVAPAAGQPVLR